MSWAYGWLAVGLLTAGLSCTQREAGRSMKISDSTPKMEAELVSRYGEAQRPRIQRGLRQAATFWKDTDGDAAAFEEFVRNNFAGDPAAVDTLFERCQKVFEKLDGHMNEIQVALRAQSDLDVGPVMPYDEVMAGYDPAAHLTDDFFSNKLAFTILLNFPLTTLEERLQEGPRWTRRQWAEARLAQRFRRRVPAEVNLNIAQAVSRSDQYISEYNIWMHHVLDGEGRRLFPAGMKLLSHWNLRDQIKADYSEKDGLARQRLIAQVMEHIIRQTIPAVAVNNPRVDWSPAQNTVRVSEAKDHDLGGAAPRDVTNAPEPDRRYELLLNNYRALRQVDPYSPSAPTHIARMFDEARELPESRVRQMFEQALSSPLLSQVATLIEQRLGRPLEPFDIWYNGFRPRGKYTEAQLDEITRKRYPTAEAYRKDMPRMFQWLGFSPERARYLMENIVVEPARGSGHAWGAQMREAPSRLRTRVPAGGMDYKGFNIAVHEMGHNVEQTFSLKNVDYYTLSGVPNTAFTEAVAFVFQANDLALLGLEGGGAGAEAMKTLNDYWATCEIAAVALVDMDVWRWMYEHPNATPRELKEATLRIAADVWNRFYAPVFKQRDVVLLAVYSHMIHSNLYLPDYPIGHLIAHQLEEHVRKAGKIGPEIERVTKQGDILPDLWMQGATGSPVSAEALLEATQRALVEVTALKGGR